MEEKKNKKLYLIISLLSLLVLGLILYIVYDKFLNNSSNKEFNINHELVDVMYFAQDNGKIVALRSDGKEILIHDFQYDKIKYEDNYISLGELYSELSFDYDEYEKVIYVYLASNKVDKYLISIDLKVSDGKYTPKVVSKINLDNNEIGGTLYNIAKLKDSIYLYNGKLFKFNINTQKTENINVINANRHSQLLKYKSNIILHDSNNIYMYDTIQKRLETILTDSSLGFIYNNKLIYYRDGKIGNDKNEDIDMKYYIYDFDTKESKMISNTIYSQSIYKDYVVPVKDSIYSFKDLNLYKYENDIIKNVYEFNCDDFKEIMENCNDEMFMIEDIDRISENEFRIVFMYDYNSFSGVFNIKNKILSNLNDNYHTYSYIYYLY